MSELVTIRQQLNPVEGLLSDLLPLMEANARAVGRDLAIDTRVVVGMHPLVWAARINGKAVGYIAHLIQPHPLFGGRWATCLAIYVEPEHRDLAPRLVRHAEMDLKRQEVDSISYSVPHLSRAGSFFEAMGYDCSELVMTKRL